MFSSQQGTERGGPRPSLGERDPCSEPRQEPLHEHPSVRPLACQATSVGGRGGVGLYQRQLDAGELEGLSKWVVVDEFVAAFVAISQAYCM